MIIRNKPKLVIINRNHITNTNIKYSELLFSRIRISIIKQIIIRNRNSNYKAK